MKPKILFVDDEQNILDSLRLSMRCMRAKWEVSFALGARVALELLEQQPHEVIVSDMRMPGMDGAQLLREVQLRYPKSVRIILSGYSEEESVLKTVKLAHQYLSKPCRPVDLIEAVEKALSLRDVLENQQIKTLVSSLDALPSLPDVYKQLVAALEEEHSTLKQLGDIVAEDVAMSASILRLVNSAFFGLPTRISSVQHAVNLIGGQTLRVLVLSSHLFTVLEAASMPSFSVKKLWEHSLRVGCFAKLIAEAEGLCRDEQDNAFIAGMLHDVGKLILAANMPSQYRDVLAKVQTDAVSVHVAEQNVFEASHAQVGAYLLGLWGFSYRVMGAVCWHHTPEKQIVEPCCSGSAVYVADGLDHELVLFSKEHTTWPLCFPGVETIRSQERLALWRCSCSKVLETGGCGNG
jgi:HD-like signal output (HDOD) protein/CheY-like chemotaxis protein